jgi:3-isopropylmalate/(R)-2-methylmalate dehydratase small subunit
MSAQPFERVTGPAVAILRKNIDTDLIIRIEKSILPRDYLGQYAFESLRRNIDGSENSDCSLNDPRFQKASILLSAENFGCGSSREAAVWALRGMGIRSVIAPSFGDIFFNNCFQNGILPIRLAFEEVGRLHDLCRDGAALTVDLDACVIVGPDASQLLFKVDPAQREGLLSGLDDIELTLKSDSHIRSWQDADKLRRPWVWHAQMQRCNDDSQQGG